MVIDQQALINELQALEQQRQDAQAQLARVDGALQLCRHLLQKSAQQAEQKEPALNGDGK